jgi:hypothetical protein
VGFSLDHVLLLVWLGILMVLVSTGCEDVDLYNLLGSFFKHMKIINAILRYRSTESGFGLALSTGFALIAIIIALTIVGRSLKDSTVSAAQKTTSRSLSAAEAGITRYLALIDKYRYISSYPDCQSRGSNGTCNDTGTIPSWANPTAIPRLSCLNPSEILSQSQNGIWKDLDPSDPSKGQYKLVSYTHTPGTPDGEGALVVDGRIQQRGSGSSASNDIQTGITRLQVNIPVHTANPTNLAFPGLWVNNAPSSSNNEFQANVVLGCSTTATLNVTGADPSGKAYTVSQSISAIPSLPAKPAFPPSNILGDITGTATIPLPTDFATIENINGVQTKIYRYSVNSINLQNQALTINTTVPAIGNSAPPQKVILYLDGDITVGGNPSSGIDRTCKDTNGNAATNCDLTNLQIYGYKPNGQICPHGNGGIFDSFIFAPTYQVGLAGGGNSGGFSGAIWADTWANGGGCGSNTSHIVLRQTGGWDQLTPFLSNVLSPQIGSVNNWKILPSS